MAEKQFDKLVRDKIPSVITADGAVAITKVLTAQEIIPALLAKLTEETGEFVEATEDNILFELADMQEVLDALTVEAGYTLEQRQQVQAEKYLERGGFKLRIFLEKIVTND